jgi:hypothetical protein
MIFTLHSKQYSFKPKFEPFTKNLKSACKIIWYVLLVLLPVSWLANIKTITIHFVPAGCLSHAQLTRRFTII